MVLVFTNLQVYWLNHKKKSLIEIYQFTEKNSEWMIRTETKNIDYSFESPASWQQERDRNALSVITLHSSGSSPNFSTALFKIGKCSQSNFIFLCKDCFVYSGSFTFPYKCWDQLVNFCKIPAAILTRIVLNLQINLERIDI